MQRRIGVGYPAPGIPIIIGPGRTIQGDIDETATVNDGRGTGGDGDAGGMRQHHGSHHHAGGHTYYAGVHNDMARVSGSGNYDYDFMTRSRAFIDLPFSLLADTLYAPVDYFHGPYRDQPARADAQETPR
ncbi:hypothetical protein O0544_22435 [Edwardsiella anguillarum]|nr:hypothetical protein [Edwardsiella anguillarum]